MQLKDIGHAELGAESYDTDLEYSGHEAIGVGVQQLSNANALEVDRAAKAALLELSKSFPPGMKYVVAFDTTTVIGDSVKEVITTLEEAIVIVIAVIFLFLLDWRATVIPAITIPVSLIGTFVFIKLLGFSINSLTLFGITLATGLVVDDAIVVIENVQRHISVERCDPHKATSNAMKEVTSAVIATSLVLISVFVPVSFFPGTTGILYKQFALTIAFSIAISAFNALTLSPALAALFLRGEEEKYKMLDWTRIKPLSRAYSGFAHGVEAAIRWTGGIYARIIHFVLRMRYVMLVIFFAGLAATVYVYRHVPTGFIPQEDQNYLICVVQTPPGASLNYTAELSHRAEELILQDSDVFGTFSVPGFSLSGGSAPNYGLIFVPLKSVDQRLGKGHSAPEIVARLGPKLFQVPGGIVVCLSHLRCRELVALAAFNSSCRIWDEIRCRTWIWSHTRSSPRVASVMTSPDSLPAIRQTTRNFFSILIVSRPKPWACPLARSRMHWASTWGRSMSMTSISTIVLTVYSFRLTSRFA